MSDNIIYEISRLMNDRSLLRNDMNDAAGLVTEMFRKKYLDRLNAKVAEHRRYLRKNPPKELQLMNALREFMPESNRVIADKVIETYILADAVATLQKESLSIQTNTNGFSDKKTGADNTGIMQACPQLPEDESSVHDDGIYDLDMNCIKGKNKKELSGLLIMMAMMMR